MFGLGLQSSTACAHMMEWLEMTRRPLVAGVCIDDTVLLLLVTFSVSAKENTEENVSTQHTVNDEHINTLAGWAAGL